MSCTLLALLALAPLQGPGGVYQPGRMQEREDLEAYVTPPSQEGVEEGFWLVQEDVRLHHFAEGQGQDVLFLHGGPGFPPHAPAAGLSLLEDRFRVHYYHQRGCGLSTRPFDRFESPNFMANVVPLIQTLGIQQHVADVERIRRILGREQLTLVGHSFGGYIATLYAIEFPERVERLVLVSPAEILKMPVPGGGMFEKLKEKLPEGEVREEYDQYLARFFGTFGAIFQKSEEELVALNREFAGFYVQALEAQGLSTAGVGAPEGYDSGWMPFGAYFSLGMSYDHTPALARITCPVLIVHGARDIGMGREALAPYETIENATVAVIPDAGHFAFDERPVEFAGLLKGDAGERESGD